ncbi:hypothetical protein ACNNLQ_04440 [Aerococcus urinaeequi]
MFEKDYNKQRIISLAEKYGKLKYEYDVSTLEKRLDDIIQFLNRTDVENALENKTTGNMNNYFYTKVMNITKAKGGAYESYDFNIIDAIFLAILISLYDNPFFKKIRSEKKAKTISIAEEDEWTSALGTKTKEFSGVWVAYKKEEDEKRNKIKKRKIKMKEIDDIEVRNKLLIIKNRQEEKESISWEVVVLNIESLLYRLTLAYHNKKAIENRQKLNKLINDFGGLPEHHQVTFYEKKMQNKINTILKEFDSYIEELKVNDPEEYETYLVHKTLFEIDKKY